MIISDHAKSIVKSDYKVLNVLKNNPLQSKMLQSMKDLKERSRSFLGSGVEVLIFEDEITDCAYASNSLFLREWYSSFYDIARQNKTTVIISNPG